MYIHCYFLDWILITHGAGFSKYRWRNCVVLIHKSPRQRIRKVEGALADLGLGYSTLLILLEIGI